MRLTRFAVGATVALAALTAAVVASAPFALRRYVRSPRGELFDSDGVAIHYSIEGTGTPVVLLHGFAVNADLNWRLPGLAKKLVATGYQVILMDLRGHGASEHSDRYGAEMGEDVVRLLDHLEIERAHVVGYSLGGVIALKLAVTRPDRLLTASPLGSGWESPDNSMFLGAIDEIAEALESGSGVGPLGQHLGDDRSEPSAVHDLWVRFMTSFLNEGPALAGVVRGLPDLTVTEEELVGIDLPMCSIVGGEDPMRAGSEALVGRVPDVEILVIDGADHLKTTSHPKTSATLIDFLARNTVPG